MDSYFLTAKYAKDAKDLSQTLRPSVFSDDPVTHSSQRLWHQHNSWVLNRLDSDHRITRSPDHPIARHSQAFSRKLQVSMDYGLERMHLAFTAFSSRLNTPLTLPGCNEDEIKDNNQEEIPT